MMKREAPGSNSGGGMERALHEAEEAAFDVATAREQVLEEARRRGVDVEGEDGQNALALRLLANAQRELLALRQDKATLSAQLERARREQVMLQGRVAAGQEEEEAAAQAVLDSSLLSARLSIHDRERAKGVVDLLRSMHSLGVEALPPGPLQRLQVTEAKRNLNRALRCLVLENQGAVHTAIWEVLRFLDGHEAAEPQGDAPSIQLVFVEGESLLCRMNNLRLQPRDVYLLASLGDDCPRGGWGLKAVLAVSDTPVVFSAPFQLRLDAVARGPQGVLCPEWVPTVDATDAAGQPIIPPSYRARIKDNCTFVYAPLRDSAKTLVRVRDMEPFEGLALAFSARTRSVELMLVSYEGPAEVKTMRTHLHTAELTPVGLPQQVASEAGAAAAKGVEALLASVRVAGHRAADCVVRVTRTTRIPDRAFTDDEGGPKERRYRVHDFAVSLAGDGAMGVAESQTRITLAFPLDGDGRPLPKEQRREGRLHTELLFSQMPLLRGGRLPFAVNADFDVTGDVGGLHPTSAWNHWLLGCVARLFVLALLRDPLLRDHADDYTPVAEETPAGGLWDGFVETGEKLLQAYLLVKTESGLLVTRAQAVARPAGVGQELVPDELLRETTKGRKHFAVAPADQPANKDGGRLPPCSLELVLQCVERAQAGGRLLDDRALAQLWTYLAGALAPGEGEQGDDEGGLSARARALLQEKVTLCPVQGQAAPRPFRLKGLPVFLPPPTEQQPPLDPALVPLLDTQRLRAGGLGGDAAKLQAAFKAVGLCEATPAGVEAMALGLFEPQQQQQQPAILQEPDGFWALRTLVVETLGAAATLRAFLGDRAALVLPALEAAAGGGKAGDGVAPRAMSVEPGADASERFLLPTFLGVPLGPLGAVLHKTAAWEEPKRKGLLRPPGPVTAAPSLGQATPALPWRRLVQWEAAMLAEVGTDGGSNRNWPAALELLPPQELAAAVVAGLVDPKTTPKARGAFTRLLDGYLEQHAQVFELIRAAHRPPNAELLRLVQDPGYADTPRGAPLRFTRAFAQACVELLPLLPEAAGDGGRAAPLTVEEVAAVLPLAPVGAAGNSGGAKEGEEAVMRFHEATSLAVTRLDSLFSAALALHVLTRRLAERGALAKDTEGGGWRAAQPQWGRLLAALFRRAVGNLGHAYGAGIRNRKRKRPGAGGSKDLLEEDAALLQAYCREFGLWLPGPGCVPLSQIVWSLDDPVARVVQGAGKAEEGEVAADGEEGRQRQQQQHEAVPPLVALDQELSGVLEAEEEEEGAGGREMVRRFFTEGLGLEGEGRFKQRLLALLRQGLERWAQHKEGPMPRDVEQAYRALGEAAAAATAKGGSAAAFGFEEVPVLTLGFQLAALAVARSSSGAGLGLSLGGSNGGGGGGGGGVAARAEDLAKSAQAALVGVADAGDGEASALHWFYREFFPSRCLHPAIFSLLRICSPAALLPRLRLVQPRQCFLESYADTTGSVLSIMKAMNVDQVKAAKVVAELYAGNPVPTPAATSPDGAVTQQPLPPPRHQMPVTELGRYWAHAKELRDVVLEEVWRAAADPTGGARNDELVEAVKNSLRLPLARRTGALPSAPVEMVSAARAASGGEGQGPPVYLGSILGIDLELQDRGEELPRLVKHPNASKESSWHRSVRPEDGFQAVEQSVYWERFLLEMGVKPLEEKHLPLLSREVLGKVFVTLAKFNGLLNGPDQTVASKYAVWTSYHFLYQALDGGRYISRYKGVDARSSSAAAAAAPDAVHQHQHQHLQHMGGWDAAAAAAAAAGYAAAPMGLQASLSGGGYAGYYGQAAAGGAGAGAAGEMGYAYPAAPAAAPVAVAAAPAASPPPPPSMSAGGLPPPPVKRQRESTGSGAAGGGATDEAGPNPPKAPRLVPPVPPPAPAAPVQEDGEIEEGEIEG